MRVRFLTDRTDGIEAGDIVDLDPAEAERVIASGGGVAVTRPKKRGETPDRPPMGETREGDNDD